MFAIGDKKWPGVSKLMEECGEVIQVLGKLMGSRGKIEHWSGDLNAMLHDEIGDLLGAIQFVIIKSNLNRDKIEKRASLKLQRFLKWHQEDPE